MLLFMMCCIACAASYSGFILWMLKRIAIAFRIVASVSSVLGLAISSSTRAVRCSAFSLYRVQVLKGAHMHRGVRPDVQPPRLKLARRALLASMVMSLLYGRMGSVSVHASCFV